LHRNAFVDIVDSFGRSTLNKLQITFPFSHKILGYKINGWDIYKSIREEVTRWGIDLANSS